MEIPLWKDGAPGFDAALGQQAPGLTPCLVEGARGAVIVLPGGGYTFRAEHEGLPVARMLNDNGISAFVLSYRVAPYRAPIPQLDARRAIRARAPSCRTDWHRQGQGRHSRLLRWRSPCGLCRAHGGRLGGRRRSPDPVERESARPDAAILCYPVVSMGEYAHAGSRESLLGADADDSAARRAYSLELCAGKNAPPCFLWHTADDAGVPVQNSLSLAAALAKNYSPFSLHVYPHGRHGLGLAQGDPLVGEWPAECVRFLQGLGF